MNGNCLSTLSPYILPFILNVWAYKVLANMPDFDVRLKLSPRFTGLCAGNSPVTDEFPAQMASNAENVSIWWHHHGKMLHGINWKKCN